MPWTPRGGKALSRAASGRVPGPRTTNSCVKGIMLLIIFVIMLMVASFEHSLAAAAHKIGLDKDVEFAAQDRECRGRGPTREESLRTRVWKEY